MGYKSYNINQYQREMNPVRKNAHDLEYWKDKYLNSVDDSERKEKQLSELENLLRQAISRLSVVGYGINPVLDSKLDELRQAVRGNRHSSRLDELIRSVSDTAALLKDPEQSPWQNPTKLLAQLLDDVMWPAAVRNHAQRLKNQLAAVKETDDPQPLVHQFIKLLQTGLENSIEARSQSPNSDQHKKERGFLARVRGAITPSLKFAATKPSAEQHSNISSPTAEAQVLNRLLDRSLLPTECQAEVDTLRQQMIRAAKSLALGQLTDEVAALLSKWLRQRSDSDSTPLTTSLELHLNQVLLELLVRLEVPPDLESRVEELKDNLSDEINPQKLPSILESMAALMTDMRRDVIRERQEIEQFLKSITDRLVLLDSNLQEAEHSRKESLEDGLGMGNTIRDQVTHLRTSMAEVVDLEQLKRAINTGLDAVQERMEAYMLSEEKRSQEADNRIRKLGTQLNEVKAWAGTLQEQIQQQRSRAVRDGLTGLNNRLAYDERIQQEFLHWKRYHDPLSLLVIDVDHFKVLNDTYGHQAGDKTLKILAEQLQTNVREADFVARYGGEEFVVIMPRTRGEDAFKVATKLRGMVEEFGFHYHGQPVPVTICCGIAQFHDGDTPESVFRRGDEALYQAKRQGRNRCCLEEIMA